MSPKFWTMNAEEQANIGNYPAPTIVIVSVLIFVSGSILLFELQPRYRGGWSPSINVFDRSRNFLRCAQTSIFLDAGIAINPARFVHILSIPMLARTRQWTTHEYFVAFWDAADPPNVHIDRRGAKRSAYFKPNELPTPFQMEGDASLIRQIATRLGY